MSDTLHREQEHFDLRPSTATTGRPVARVVVVAVVIVVVAALLAGVGFAVGWSSRGSGGASSPSYVISDAVVVGDELTDRQRKMVDVTEQYVAAFIAHEGEAVASFMVPDGFLAMPTLADRIVHVSDGSLQDWVVSYGRIPNELNDPIAVSGNQVVLTGHVGDTLDWMMLIEFTDSGDVEIVSDTHWAF